MKVGIVYNTGSHGVDPAAVIAVARHAESCGFESFYVTEHIALYPGAKAGPFEFPPSLPIAAPLELLSFVAGTTERILLGMAVLLLPTDEAISVLRLLWAGDENGVSFDGEFFSFTNLCSFPKPLRPGTLPIHVGGASPAAPEYTRWVPASISAAEAGAQASLGATRLVAALGAADLDGQREEMSALAGRLGLR